MDLTLSSVDQDRLESALRTLLSPLDSPCIDAWRIAVNRSLKELLGADRVGFLLPLEGITPVCTEGALGEVASQYPDRIRQLASRWSLWERATALGAYDRDLLFRGRLEEYYRSEYYNEYIVPGRYFDAICLAVPLAEKVSPGTVAQVLLHHEHPQGRKFGSKGLGLLRLLLPAFRAGVQTQVRLAGERNTLASSLDALGERLLIFDLTGRVLHQTAALTCLFARDPGKEILEREMGRIADTLSRLIRSGGTDERALKGPIVREVRTPAARYKLRGNYVDLLGSAPCVMVALELSVQELPSEETIQKRFGLTRAEARIARLLAAGKSNQDIAKTLCISPHTAKCHTERVLRKLDLHSRAAVSAALLNG